MTDNFLLGDLFGLPKPDSLGTTFENLYNGFGIVPNNVDRNAYLEAIANIRTPGFGTLLSPPQPVVPIQWYAVQRRFSQFHSNLSPSNLQLQDRHRKSAGVIACLNRAVYGIQSDTAHSFVAGSWAKQTAVHPWSDMDIYFVMPYSAYQRFETYVWNRQSALLQYVRSALADKYPDTEISGDGQVVAVRFETQKIEVIPAFELTTPRQYWICDTKLGGNYRVTAPWDEQGYIEANDSANGNNVRPLVRMLKAWRHECNVPIKAFHLEMMVIAYLQQCEWRYKGWFYYDWIVKGFFETMPQFANQVATAPGTGERSTVGADWVTHARTAYSRALRACDYEQRNLNILAGIEWQEIFGSAIPRE